MANKLENNANYAFEKGAVNQCMKNTIFAMTELTKNVIGVFKTFDKLQLVIELTEHTVRCITIGELLGVQDTTFLRNNVQGIFIPLPKGYNNLNELINQPFVFYDWYKENIDKSLNRRDKCLTI